MLPAQETYSLPEDTNQTIFESYVLPIFFDFTASSVKPRAVFLGGQSGSGKSSLAAFQLASFPKFERAVVVNSDALREYHPSFSSLQKTNVNQASFLVNPDTIKWQQKLIAATIDTKRNLILDGTLGGNPEPIRETIRRLRLQGYHVQISLLAVPARLSRLGIYKRYEDQVALKGVGRWVGMANHDRLYEEIPHTVALLEREKAVDKIQIFTRPTGSQVPEQIYENEVKNGQWQHQPTAVDALTAGRNRPWSQDEHLVFTQAGRSVSKQMQQRGASQTDIADLYRHAELQMLTHRFAQLADSQLYINWANDPDTRRQSFNSAPISPETHAAWFTRKLADPNALLLVFEEAGEAVGQVRFERTPVADTPDEVIIGVSVDANRRGKGLASQLIERACAVCREQWGAVEIHAHIKPDNQASVRAFERAGFTLSGESGKFAPPGQEAGLVFTYTT